MATIRQANTRKDVGELSRDARRARRVAVAECETLDPGMLARLNRWLAEKGPGLGEYHHEPERRPLFIRKEQPPIETHSLLAAQLRAVVVGAKRDGRIWSRHECGDE